MRGSLDEPLPCGACGEGFDLQDGISCCYCQNIVCRACGRERARPRCREIRAGIARRKDQARGEATP